MISSDESPEMASLRKQDPVGKKAISAGRLICGEFFKPAVLIVGFVWLFLTASSLFILWRQGLVLPWSDDWAMVPAIASKQPITLTWLWAQHNEHRIVLPKLFYLLSVRLGHGDYRYQVPGNIAALSLVTLFLLLAVRKLRGRLSVFDVFIPLIILNLGQGGVGWGFHFQFVSVTVLACAFLAILLWQGPQFSWWGAFLSGACLCALPLCGGSGLFYALILGPWLAVRGFLQVLPRRAATSPASYLEGSHVHPLPRAVGLLMAVSAAGALALCALYFIGYQKPPSRESAGILLSLKTSARILSSGFGMKGPDLYPYLAFALSVLFGGALTAVRALNRKNDWRERILFFDLTIYMGAVLLLLLAVGYSRGAMWNDGMKPHYTSLASPALIGSYLVFSFVAPPAVGKPINIAMILLIAFFSFGYIKNFHQESFTRRAITSEIEHDFLSNLSAEAIVDKDMDKLFYANEPFFRAQVIEGIRAFRKNGFSLYGAPEANSPALSK
jgi:hypothetical protein